MALPTPHLVSFLVAIMLVACTSPLAIKFGATLQPIATTELRGTLEKNTLSRSGGPFWHRWTYRSVHRANGTMTGRVTWSGGEENTTGVWEISSNGHYCRTWSNAWGSGKRGCFQVSRPGDTLVFNHVSGASGDANRYLYRVLPREPQSF